MAALYNLVAMTVSSAPGAGSSISLGNAATINGVTYLSFTSAGTPSGTSVAYSILDTGASETGTSTFLSSGPLLSGRTPTKSTNGNAAIVASSAAIILCSPRAEDIISTDLTQTFTAAQRTQARSNIAAAGLVSELTDVAWPTWVPTFSMFTTGATPITAAVAATGARYKQIGKTVLFTLDAAISNIGVGNGASFLFTLPVTGWNGSMVIMGTGKEVITTGKLLVVQANSTTQGAVLFYDNTSLISGGNGTRVQIGGFYEVP